MNGLTKMVALVMLALWVPLTAHCGLEVLSGLDLLVCGEHQDSVPHQDSDCTGDWCASVESGDYRVEDNPPLHLFPPVFDVAVDVDRLVPAPRAEPIIATQTCSPPELPRRWRFFYRTALPPRAPSLNA